MKIKLIRLSAAFMFLCVAGYADNKIELGPNKFNLVLPSSLDNQRDELEENLRAGYEIIADFATRHGWTHLMADSYVDHAIVFDSKHGFDEFIIELLGAPRETKLPLSFVAGLERRIYTAVSPELYKALVPKLVEHNFYSRLFAHEIAHRLHIRVLNGNEEAMGPIWFFEGFAVLAAGQLEDFVISEAEIWRVVERKDRGDYRAYGATLRYFLKKTTLQDLVARAGDAEFSDWLRSL
jgi:hypothetical protein